MKLIYYDPLPVVVFWWWLVVSIKVRRLHRGWRGNERLIVAQGIYLIVWERLRWYLA